MKKLFSLAVMAAVLGAFIIPGLYFYYSLDLPPIATASEVRASLGRRIDAERMANSQMGHALQIEKFDVLPLTKVPKGIVAGLLAAEACPEYLQAAKEEPVERTKRVFRRAFAPDDGQPGPGRCQLRFARLVAETVGAADEVHVGIATNRILAALDPEELLTFRLASTYYAPGILGLRDASLALFRKEPALLDVAQSAELILAESWFPEMEACKNPGKLKLLRDDVIDRMEAFGTIPAADAKRARAKPLSCTLHPY